jgi:phage terminase small subunit
MSSRSKPTKIAKRESPVREIYTRDGTKLYNQKECLEKPLNELDKVFLEAYFKTNSTLQAFFVIHPEAKEEYETAEARRRLLIRNKGINYANKPRIKARIEEAQLVAEGKFEQMAARFAASEAISKMRIVEELAKVAFSDPRKIMEWDGDGNFKAVASTELDPDSAAAISGVKVIRGKTIENKHGTISVPDLVIPEIHNKREALMDLARLLGYTEEKSDAPKVAVQFIIEK